MKLAVITMLVLGGVVAWGTVLESRYNSDYAKIVVYQAPWFLALLGVLFVNIFVATIMRYPYKKIHIGFVITHIGLLTLLVGSMLTAVYGIDGSMRVPEGGQGNQVVLPEYVIELAPKAARSSKQVPFSRSVTPRNEGDFASLNEELGPGIKVLRFEPFVEASSGYRSDAALSNEIALRFRIKSPFFDVQESLASRSKPFTRMGPALFKMKTVEVKEKARKPSQASTAESEAPATPKKQPAPKKKAKAQKRMIRFVDAKSGEMIAETSYEAFVKKGLTVRGLNFNSGKEFKSATVGKGGVEEVEGGKPNPALEIKITKGDASFRDVLFERFPEFSLHPEGVEGIKVSYLGPSAEDSSASEAGVAETGSGAPPNDSIHSGMGSAAAESASNEVTFTPAGDGKVKVELRKEGKKVLEKLAAPGDEIETPWMGMKLTVQELVENAVEEMDVRAVSAVPRQELPPAAVMLQVDKGFPQLPFYLVEGDSRDIRIRDRDFTVYFGRRVIELPFMLRLEKFSKVDYPGTQTAMSYESDVEVGQDGQLVKISMNEPLKRDKYTLYQASFQMGNGQQTASIFSVNYDPGRATKYIGSLIAAIGIIIYTLMRSRLAKKAAA